MKLLGRIFLSLATNESHEWAMTLGLYTYRVKRLADGGGFIALGVESYSHPELQMAKLAIWPKIPNETNCSEPFLVFSMLRNPGVTLPSMSTNLRSKLVQGESGEFAALCGETLEYVHLIFKATEGKG
jgi:hypothetical protein